MGRTFDIIMRLVSTLLGLLLLAAGSIWILQGLNLAFKMGFMVGDWHWTLYGAIAAIIALLHIVWTWRRA